MVLYICVIDQACLIKMAGYWPSSFLCVYGPGPSPEVQAHKLEKKNKANIQPS